MKKNLQLSIILILSIFLSCQKEISKEKLTTIDNIVLGTSLDKLYKQMDSLSIPRKRFLTTMLKPDYHNEFIDMRYTDMFNLSQYKSWSDDNIGLLYPMTLQGTKNVIGMIVILGHSTRPIFAENENSEKAFIQDINAKLIEDIKNLYISKYGQPSDTFSLSSHRVYFIKGNQIIETGDPKREGFEYRWETEYYSITFFTGLPSYESRYNSTKRTYDYEIQFAENFNVVKPDVYKNEVQSFSYCYIEYKLNDKAIKELNLNKINL
jgi:hypothetical protein